MAGLFSRLLGRPAETRSTESYGDGWDALANMSALASGGPVSTRMAENLSTVLACVNAIASGLASLPAAVYRTEGDGRVEVPGHPVSRLLRAPNTHQTWPDWLEWTLASVLLHGNALSAVEYDGAGRPTALHPIPWSTVTVQALPTGRLAYDVANGKGPVRRYLEDDCFHLRDRSDDGVIGRSRLSRAPDVVSAALGLQTFSSAVWDNAARPSGMVTFGPQIGSDGARLRRFRAQFNQAHKGRANAGRVVFGDSESKFTPFSISPEDAEVLSSRQFSVIEMCRLYNVPPPIVQSYEFNSFTNASQASIWFATNTLTPWARKIESEFSRSVFVDPAFHLEIDLSGLLRGDYATRWAANVAAVNANILTADEVRAQEGYGPRPKEPTPPVATAV